MMEIKGIIEKLFPNLKVKSIRSYPYRNSRIFIISLADQIVARRLIAKYYNINDPDKIAGEYDHLSRFFKEPKDARICSPEPLYLDAQKGFIILEHVDGVNLSYMLHGLRPVAGGELENLMDLSALALAEFHRIFAVPDGEPLFFDPGHKERDIHQCMLKSREYGLKYDLDLKVMPFFDFSPWNILCSLSGKTRFEKAYLIDFPKTRYVSTPHQDLGRFLFGIELIKQYPPSRFLRIDHWDDYKLFQRFLTAYCIRMKISPNENDLKLINEFLRANIRRSQDISRKERFSWQSRLERLYLRTFSKEWLERATSGV